MTHSMTVSENLLTLQGFLDKILISIEYKEEGQIMKTLQ